MFPAKLFITKVRRTLWERSRNSGCMEEERDCAVYQLHSVHIGFRTGTQEQFPLFYLINPNIGNYKQSSILHSPTVRDV